MKQKIINGISMLAYHAGVFSIYKKLCLKDKLSIVFYHDVVDKSPFPGTKLFIENNMFWDHMDKIKGEFNIININDIFDGKRNKKYPIVISFDGYSWRYVEVAQELSKRGISAIFYLQTEPIISGRPHWQQELYYIFANIRNKEVRVRCQSGEIQVKVGNDQVDNILVAGKFSDLIEKEKGKRDIVDGLAHEYKVGLREFDERFRPLNNQEIREMSGMSNIEIGSHSHTHTNFQILGDKEITNELNLSKRYLESLTGNKVIHFCYPGGVVNDKFIELLGAAGYVSACTTEKRVFGKEDFERMKYRLPRYSVSNNPFYVLAGELMGLRAY